MQICEKMNLEVKVEKKLLNKVLPMYYGSSDVQNPILNSRLLFSPCYWVLSAWCYLNTVRVTGHKTPGESSVDITDCNYDTTYLQENSQRLE